MNLQLKQIAVLGATGSIGRSTLSVIRQHPNKFQVASLTCRKSVEKLCELIREFKPRLVSVQSEAEAREIRDAFPNLVAMSGSEGLIRVAEDVSTDLVVAGIVGAVGLYPAYAAISAGKNIALANKEPLVLAGELFMKEASRTGATILPADSEHNAIFQILDGRPRQTIRRLILTASGGPFRDLPLEKFSGIRMKDALDHPNWEMGKKITIDSATMMNKGLEIIEASWLFGIALGKISVLVHRESIVHSLIEYKDGSLLAQLGLPDMRIPLSFCLGWPERLELELPQLDLGALGALQFEKVDPLRFPCVGIALKAADAGQSATAVLNGANEALVESYLEEQISFLDIPRMLERVMSYFSRFSKYPDAPACLKEVKTLEDALQADEWGRDQILQLKQNRDAA